jgi:hypothetical protein
MSNLTQHSSSFFLAQLHGAQLEGTVHLRHLFDLTCPAIFSDPAHLLTEFIRGELGWSVSAPGRAPIPLLMVHPPTTERPSIPLAELISREVGMDNERGPEN